MWCIGACLYRLFTKQKEPIQPSILRESSYIHSQIQISSPSHKKMEYEESIAYQLA